MTLLLFGLFCWSYNLALGSENLMLMCRLAEDSSCPSVSQVQCECQVTSNSITWVVEPPGSLHGRLTYSLEDPIGAVTSLSIHRVVLCSTINSNGIIATFNSKLNVTRSDNPVNLTCQGNQDMQRQSKYACYDTIA